MSHYLKLYEQVDNVTSLVMIDYKKAFDLIRLFESYLSDRTQYVNIDGCHSDSQRCKPWSASREYPGTSLVSYIYNDLPKILEHSAADLYPDDTTISANVDYRPARGALNQVLEADVGKVA